MALTFATYVAPQHARLVAVAAVVVLVAVNLCGVTRTALVAKVLLVVVFVLLLLTLLLSAPATSDSCATRPVGVLDVLQAAGLLFFAFAGYAPIATLGEEVREPPRTIPRAILAALGATLVIYLAVGLVLLDTLGPQRLAG